MSFPRYPTYKHSRIDQLGDVPEDWDVVPVKRCLKSITQGWSPQCENYSADAGQWGVLKVGCVNGGSFDPSENKALPSTLEPLPELSIRRGDVLVSRANTRELVGSVAVAERDYERLILCDKLYRLRVDEQRCDAAFLASSLSTPAARGVIEATASGASSSMLNIGQAAITGMFIAVPPLKEQQALIAFVQREAAKIDALVEEQLRLIELLKEKRQAVISRAVTKGLTPSVPMKDSEVNWLGKVPAHWEVRKVNSLSTKITNGYVGPTRDILVDDGVRYLQSLHIKSNRIKFDVPYFVEEAWSQHHKKSMLETGDLLIVQTGDIGQAAVVTDEFAGSNCHALIIVSPLRDVVFGEYLGWVFNSDYGKHSLLAIQTGALHPHLNCGNVKDVFVPVPPKLEQSRIVEHCVAATSAFDELMTQAEAAVALLNERRAALISAAVTGKIDVRGPVPQREAVPA